MKFQEIVVLTEKLFGGLCLFASGIGIIIILAGCFLCDNHICIIGAGFGAIGFCSLLIFWGTIFFDNEV